MPRLFPVKVLTLLAVGAVSILPRKVRVKARNGKHLLATGAGLFCERRLYFGASHFLFELNFLERNILDVHRAVVVALKWWHVHVWV